MVIPAHTAYSDLMALQLRRPLGLEHDAMACRPAAGLPAVAMTPAPIPWPAETLCVLQPPHLRTAC